MSQLSSLVGFSVTQSSEGLTLTTANGTPLVVGGESFALSTAVNSSTGFQDVISAQGQDITSQISAGQLGGILQARDGTIAGVLSSLNTLAGSFASAINTVNESRLRSERQAGNSVVFGNRGSRRRREHGGSHYRSEPDCRQLERDGKRRQQQPAEDDRCRQPAAGEFPDADTDALGNGFSGWHGCLAGPVGVRCQLFDAASNFRVNRVRWKASRPTRKRANLLTYQRAYQAAARVVPWWTI